MYYIPENSIVIIKKFMEAVDRASEKLKYVELLPKKEKAQEGKIILSHLLGEGNEFLAQWCNVSAKQFAYSFHKERTKRPSNNKLGYTEVIEKIDITYWQLGSTDEAKTLLLPRPIQGVIFYLEDIDKWKGYGTDFNMLKFCKSELEGLKDDIISSQSNIYNLPECLLDFSAFRVDGAKLKSSDNQQSLFIFIDKSTPDGVTWTQIKNNVATAYNFRSVSDFFRNPGKDQVLRKFIVKDGDRNKLTNELKIVDRFSA